MVTKAYLIRIDNELWDQFLETVPRSKYTSINKALNEMIQERVDSCSVW